MNLTGITVGDRYAIEREVGRGGMATVWLANDRQHGRRVAIKTLHPDLAGAIGTDRFLREIRLTAELQHPNIVPILDSGLLTAAGVSIPWYAMPLLEGETLRDRINREQQLPVEDALRITRLAGQALQAAHQRAIVHRDIKPENVFLSGDHVYVVDFGIAKAVAATDAERLTSTGLAIGTPAYMSPEQAMAGTVDARSDQYSLASILYEMLAGEPPFAGPNQQATIARRLAEPVRPLSTVRTTVPRQVERAVLRALERTPADRFASVDAFLAALDAAPGTLSIEPKRAARWLAAAAIVATLMAGAWALWPREHRVAPEVLALYRRGVQEYDRRTQSGIVEAANALSAAIARDSIFADAWTALAKTYVRAHQRGFPLPDIPREELLRRALSAVNRALDLDKQSADAWTTHAIVTQQVEPTNVGPPLRSIGRAIALDSMQPPAWHALAVMTAERGDLRGGIEAWRRSVTIDPSYLQGLAFLALAYYWHGDYDSAMVWIDSTIAVDPNYALGQLTAAQVETERGNVDKAISHADAAIRLSEGVEWVNANAARGIVVARAGPRALAQANLLGIEVSAGQFDPLPPHTLLYLAQWQAAVGDTAGALRTLGRYATPKDVHFQLHLRCDPPFAPLEEDSAFRSMLVRPRPAAGAHC